MQKTTLIHDLFPGLRRGVEPITIVFTSFTNNPSLREAPFPAAVLLCGFLLATTAMLHFMRIRYVADAEDFNASTAAEQFTRRKADANCRRRGEGKFVGCKARPAHVALRREALL